MKNIKNKLPIAQSKGYTIILETHEIFNSKGKKMKPFVDVRGRVATKILMKSGIQKTIVIKDLVKKMTDLMVKSSDQGAKLTELDFILRAIYANSHTIKEQNTSLEKYSYIKKLVPGANVELVKDIFIALFE